MFGKSWTVVFVVIVVGVSGLTASSQMSIHVACKLGDLDAVTKLVETDDLVVNEQSVAGEYAIHAAAGGRKPVLLTRYLLDHGVDIDAMTKWGDTALHVAARKLNPELVELLLSYGADVALTNGPKQTALHAAVASGANKKQESERRLRIVKALLKFGADIESKDRDGMTALSLACMHGRIGICQSLLQNKARISSVDKKGRTALHWASFGGHVEVVHALLGRKANRGEMDKQGNTALHLAAQMLRADAVALLLENEANANALNESEQTPLILLAQKGGRENEGGKLAREIASRLIRSGAKVDLRDAADKSAFDYARDRNLNQLASALLAALEGDGE